MGKNDDKKRNRNPGLMIEYRELGTISIDELAQAILTDINALKDIYNVRYVTGVRMRIPVTNEYGEAIVVRRTGGGTLLKIDTHHYRPHCLDYDGQ